jgi:uncharacterized protein YlxW (UPF0749 family)
METEQKDKPQNNNTSAPQSPQVAPANQDADMMAALLGFIKHPAVAGIAGYLLGKYFESKKQDEEQEKVTEKLQRQIESLKEQLKEYAEERKALGTKEREPLRLSENKYKNKGVIQLD